MIKKTIAFSILLFLLFSFKDHEIRIFKSIPTEASYFTTDHIGNLYIIREDVIEKIDTAGNLSKTYTNKSFGKISSVDASNPLKLLLFYKDFSQIVFLDNMLSVSTTPVKLINYGFEQCQLACSSHNNGIWLYNLQNFELIRLDQNLQIAQKTGNINQITGLSLNPNFVLEYNNKVYLNNPLTGILVFDIYGTYYKNIHILNLQSFQVRDDNLIYFSDQKIKSFDMQTLEEEQYEIADTSVVTASFEKEKIFLLKKNCIDILKKK